LNRAHGFNPRLRPANFRQRHRAVQRDDGRIIELNELIVELENLRPVRGGVILRRAMTPGDARLKMVFGDLAARRRRGEVKHAARDHRTIPARPILLLQAQQIAFGIHAGWKTRSVQQHQGQQPMRPGLVARRMFRQQVRQANGFLAKLLAHQLFTAGRLVAFIEQEVERVQHAVETGLELAARRNLEGDVRVPDLLFGARQALGDGGFGGEKRRRDFSRAEAAKKLQGERDLSLGGHQRMTAHEHHAQPVVGNLMPGKGRRIRRRIGLRLDQARHFCLLVAEYFFAPDDIQREIARSPHDPRGGILRHAVERPRLQRPRQRFLHDVLREGQMFDAENPRQRRHHLSAFMTEKMLHHLGNFPWFLAGGCF